MPSQGTERKAHGPGPLATWGFPIGIALQRIYRAPLAAAEHSIEDEGVSPSAPTTATGSVHHRATATRPSSVDRLHDRGEDADALADAVKDALSRVLREGHIFFEHYDRRTGRLDPLL